MKKIDLWTKETDQAKSLLLFAIILMTSLAACPASATPVSAALQTGDLSASVSTVQNTSGSLAPSFNPQAFLTAGNSGFQDADLFLANFGVSPNEEGFDLPAPAGPPAPVPEPSTILLLLVGIGGMILARKATSEKIDWDR